MRLISRDLDLEIPGCEPVSGSKSGWPWTAIGAEDCRTVTMILKAGFQPLLQTFFTAETSLLSDDLTIFEDHDLRNPVSGSIVSE